MSIFCVFRTRILSTSENRPFLGVKIQNFLDNLETCKGNLINDEEYDVNVFEDSFVSSSK